MVAGEDDLDGSVELGDRFCEGLDIHDAVGPLIFGGLEELFAFTVEEAEGLVEGSLDEGGVHGWAWCQGAVVMVAYRRTSGQFGKEILLRLEMIIEGVDVVQDNVCGCNLCAVTLELSFQVVGFGLIMFGKD